MESGRPGVGRCEGGDSQKGMHPTWGLVSVKRGGLWREKCLRAFQGCEGDVLASRGHPYMFSYAK